MRAAVVIAVLLLLAILALADGHGPYLARQAFVDAIGDKLDWKSRSLAGPDAVNCGRVDRGHFADDANRCVRASQAAGKPFRVRYGVEIIDSDIHAGLVRTPQGHLYEIILSLDRSSLFRQRIVEQECTGELRVTYGGRLTCLPDRGF